MVGGDVGRVGRQQISAPACRGPLTHKMLRSTVFVMFMYRLNIQTLKKKN